jgi:tetratricopeptide (TPR) repeat protein
MSDDTIVCPSCGGAVPKDVTVCPSCQEDLSSLLRLEYQHAIYYNEALALARSGEFDQAQAKVSAALQIDESFAPAYVLMAKLLVRQERWAQARAHVARAVELTPDDEKARRLANEIETLAEEAGRRQRELESRNAKTRRAAAARQLATYQRDVAKAFGVGVILTTVVALIVSLFRGHPEPSD